MPERTEYKHGSFSWVDLGTTDAAAAKKFYGPLFGWTFDDRPAGPGMTYTMCKLGDRDAAALYEMGPDMQGVPPHWASYITVNDVDATAKKANANGGKVLKEPFDVMDVGRMAVIQDPTGAVLCLWQGKKHVGAGVFHDPGAITWVELYTTNVDAAGKFYIQTIGWDAEAVDMGPTGTYTLLGLPGEGKSGQIGGMMAMPPNMKGVPSNWLPYFAVADCDASAKKAVELGGKLAMPPTDIPNIGRFAIVQDPQGAAFAIYKNAH
jgi:hypothetical protein